jgi:hypothetical protein
MAKARRESCDLRDPDGTLSIPILFFCVKGDVVFVIGGFFVGWAGIDGGGGFPRWLMEGVRCQ